MKTTLKALGWMLTWGASAAYAAQGGETEMTGWLGYLFTGFFAVIIATQLIPAAILFGGILKGILTTGSDDDTATHCE